MKRFIVLLLACVLLLGLSACDLSESETPNIEIPTFEIPEFTWPTTEPVVDMTEATEITTQEVTEAATEAITESPTETPTEVTTEEPTEAPTEEDTTLGDYKVEIKDFRLASDFEGKPVIIITYGFTNVSDTSPAAFYLSIEDAVYQNGIGLNEAIFVDGSDYSSDNQTKELKMGASLDVEVAYELNDTTSDVEIEIKEFFSFFNTKVLTKTFSIA